MMHIGKWALLLSIFWLLLSGYIQPLLLSLGAVSIALVLVVVKRMDRVDQVPKRISSGLALFRYLGWLFIQIFISSAHVSKLVWRRDRKLSPVLAEISVQNIKPSNRVLYANSITLTPGTLSVDLDDNVVTVHALQATSIDELKQGVMENKITSIWGKNT
jgi:multicomponent Na+:H+ antiporter subunit E